LKSKKFIGRNVLFYDYNTIIVGSGAAGTNCAVHLYEFMAQKGVQCPQDRIALVTGGLDLGASRMSGSDKQTYYKMGTSPDVPDSAADFAKSLTAAGCCHGDLALAEAVGSLREFYHLVQAGVPFPHDSIGSYVGYKTDHDPYERATSAGSKTSRFMCDCLDAQLRRYGIPIYDQREVASLLTVGQADAKRIIGVVAMDKRKASTKDYAVEVYLCRNLVLAAGGPGELYKTTVYPQGQVGIHGLAFKAGLAAENLTESQFGLASIKFRWNVSGSYCQAVPRIFSTDPDGNDPRDFLAGYFPTMSKMASNIFLKGYQWPFDPQRIESCQSSLIDVLVFSENQKGRRVFMDFRQNPAPAASMDKFDLEKLEPEVRRYLQNAAALKDTPIGRLYAMNPPAIEIYRENGIDLASEPLEIAVCAQHNNGGFAVDKWWQSNIPQTFVIGEMAGTHGVKGPGGSALNSGQVGGLRAAEYIANVYDLTMPDYADAHSDINRRLNQFIVRLDTYVDASGLSPARALSEIQSRMTASAAHIRRPSDARKALAAAVEQYRTIQSHGFSVRTRADLIQAVRAEHMSLTSVAFLKAVVTLLEQGGGSRGSYLVLNDQGTLIHPDITDPAAGTPLKFEPENKALRDSILRVTCDPEAPEFFTCESVPVRQVPTSFTVESGKYTRVDTPVSCQLEGLASLPPAAIER